MTNLHSMSLGFVIALSALLSACGEQQTAPTGTKDTTLSNADSVSKTLASSNSSAASSETATTIAPVAGASEIPYPVYPNGSKYRVGGENGLKIVVFETQDTFEQVDDFYRQSSEPDSMPRLVAMNDYVRYSSSGDDKDPWATYRPGIVIHQFNDDAERSAVGAKSESRTNIIMSY